MSVSKPHAYSPKPTPYVFGPTSPLGDTIGKDPLAPLHRRPCHGARPHPGRRPSPPGVGPGVRPGPAPPVHAAPVRHLRRRARRPTGDGSKGNFGLLLPSFCSRRAGSQRRAGARARGPDSPTLRSRRSPGRRTSRRRAPPGRRIAAGPRRREGRGASDLSVAAPYSCAVGPPCAVDESAGVRASRVVGAARTVRQERGARVPRRSLGRPLEARRTLPTSSTRRGGARPRRLPPTPGEPSGPAVDHRWAARRGASRGPGGPDPGGGGARACVRARVGGRKSERGRW